MAAIARNQNNIYHGSSVKGKQLQYKPSTTMFHWIFNLNILLVILDSNHY